MNVRQWNVKKWGGGEQTLFIPVRVLDAAVNAAVRLLLSAVLAGVTVMGDKAPLGVAMTAASGAGVLGGAAALGACLGYLCQLELTTGLCYASAVMLTYAAAFAFYDVRPLRKAWAMPAFAGVSMTFTALAAHTRQVWTVEEQVGFVLELGLTVGAVWCFRAALRTGDALNRREELRQEQRRGMLVLVTALLAALVPLELAGLSVGRVMAGVIPLPAALLGGGSAAAVCGAVLGVGMDLTGEGQVLRAMVWPLAGLAAGVFGGERRARTALVWSCAAAGFSLWVQDWNAALLCAGEGVLSGLVFLALPRGWLDGLEGVFARQERTSADPGGVGAVRARLSAAAAAYTSLCRVLKDSLRAPENDGDISMVFDRCAGRICRSCSNQTLCWQRDYSSTFNALNDATAAIVERGKAQTEDFPLYFTSRCIKMPEFLAGVNEELTALFYRRQYQARVRDNREAVCRQYDQLSELLLETSEELSPRFAPDGEGRRTLSRYLRQQGVRCEVSATRDSRGLLRVSLRGGDCGRYAGESGVTELSGVLNKPLRVERSGAGEIVLVEQEPYMAVAGVAARKKDGETVSGDAGTYFKRPDGKVYLLLCDGMGSGSQANRESSLAIRLLEQFLLTGIPAHHALYTLASALALRGEETGSFTTVDLLEIDLFTGDSALYKLGAAPTYVRQGDSIRRLTGASLPAGLAQGDGDSVDRFELHLSPGDYVLMVSDGVCGSGEDGWLMERLRDFKGDSPRQLAAQLITQSPQGATDDRTALAVRFEKRT